MAAGNGGRPSYRRRRARNVDRNHHQVHAGCSRVEAGRGGEGGVAGLALAAALRGFARGESQRRTR